MPEWVIREVEGVIGKYGVPGENESGEGLLDVCVEQELVIGNFNIVYKR